MSKSAVFSFAAGTIVFVVFGLLAPVAYGQSYPTKPIRLLVGFPPGGGVDIVARQIAPKLSELLGQQIVVDNRSGAGGNLAAEQLAKSPPDGYVLMLSTPSITINPSLYGKVNFDPVNDFAPITLVGVSALALVVHPSLPTKSVKDLLALAMTRPGQLFYSSGGNGSAAHLAGELMKSLTKTSVVHVPFKGNPPSMTALIGGEVHFTFGTLSSTLSYVKARRLTALAVTSLQRSAFVPEIVTMAEAGIPGYDVTQWYGLVAPARTSAAIISRLNSEFIKVLELSEIKTQLNNQSLEIKTSTPPRFSEFIKSELSTWAKVVKESNMRVD